MDGDNSGLNSTQQLEQPVSQLREGMPNVPVRPVVPVRTKRAGKFTAIKGMMYWVLLLFMLGAGGFMVWHWLNSRGGPKQVTINYWGLREPAEVMQPLLDGFMEANPNVSVNYVQQLHEDYRRRLSNQLSLEDPEPDLFSFHNSWVPMMRGFLAAVPSTVYTTQEFEDTYYLVIQNDLKSGAAYVGIPLWYDGLAMFYNEDLFIAGRQEIPENWTEFRKVASNLLSRDDDKRIQIAGSALGTALNVEHWEDVFALMMLQSGANLAAPNDGISENVLTFFSVFTRVDKVWDATLPNSMESFANGKLAIYFGLARDIPKIKEMADENGLRLRFKVAPVPQLPEVNVAWANYWAEGVSNKSGPAEQAAAWELLNYLSDSARAEQLFQLQEQYWGSGMPYAREDLADQLVAHPQLGAFVLQAPAARSWYLVSDTTDKEGLNDKIGKIYEGMINEMATKGNAKGALKNKGEAVGGILREYGL